jgi:hypothetical protein
MLLCVASTAFGAEFRRDDIGGKRWALVHDTKIETYQFGENGVALAAFGEKNGAVAAPAYRWEVKDGRLVFALNRGTEKGPEVVRSFELVSREASTLTRRDNRGLLKVFEWSALD